jgi:phenylacetate-CoA ligase
MYSSILRNVVLPLYDLATGTPTRTYLRELEKSQWYSPTEMRELQEKKLRHLIRHAHETVPYYRKIFQTNNLTPSDINNLDDLKKLPILTRNETREEFQALISSNYPSKRTVRGTTGGSTGEPIRFLTTKENRHWNTAARYLAWEWAGFRAGDKFAHIFGSPLDQPFFKSFRGKVEGKIKRRIFMNALKISEAQLEKFVERIKTFKPEVIYGYARAALLLAQFIEDRGIEGIHLKSVIIDSMSLFEHEVKTIERVFGCRVWWNYHNRENGTFGSECSQHDGYHLFAQNHIFEFIKGGEEVAAGEPGAIVVTDLTNYAMPFIRYELGDVGISSNDLCACGRGLPLMRKLLGRTAEILLSATGEFLIFPDQFDRLWDLGKIGAFQITQENPSRVVTRIVPGRGYTDKDTEMIRKIMLSLFDNLDIEIELVDSLATSNSGKRQVIIRRFPLKFTTRR